MIPLEALERESLELKKKNIRHWDIGLKLSVQLYFLINRSKLQYPYFQIIPIYDNMYRGIINEEKNDVNEGTSERQEDMCYSYSSSINQSTTEKITLMEKDRNKVYKNRDENENKNESENKKIMLNRISHSYFPFISLRGHSWRRIIIALQHLKTPNHDIQDIVSYINSLSLFC